jgi:predicted nuclease of predicted toxin-antitoxin system
VKILVDENLSPALVHHLAKVGAAAVHVAHCGLSGASDAVVWRYAFEHDQVVVTSNVADFLQLAGDVDLHPGVIVLRAGHLSREEQLAWLLPVVRRFSGPRAGLVNRVVVVSGPGLYRVRVIPAPTRGP